MLSPNFSKISLICIIFVIIISKYDVQQYLHFINVGMEYPIHETCKNDI